MKIAENYYQYLNIYLNQLIFKLKKSVNILIRVIFRKILMRFILKFIVSAAIVLLLANFLPGIVVKDFTTSMVVVIVLSLCNAIIRPVLVLLTLPITFFTLGLFLLVINVVMIYITDMFIPGFIVNGFFNTLIFSLLLSLLNYVSDKLLDEKVEV